MLIENHPSGAAIYLNKMTENPELYTNVALYVFCGMMLKNTDIADRFLAIIWPWKLSPELLVFVIVLASAIPTAYSGASGIFVIAAGAIIYQEFKKSSQEFQEATQEKLNDLDKRIESLEKKTIVLQSSA